MLRKAEKFFGTTFRSSLVTVHYCEGRGLGSNLLKMAADSSQHVERKSAFVDPIHFTFHEGKSFTFVKSDENYVS